MRVVVCILLDGEWVPAHPGYMELGVEVHRLVDRLQSDGYRTAIVDANKWTFDMSYQYTLEYT